MEEESAAIDVDNLDPKELSLVEIQELTDEERQDLADLTLLFLTKNTLKAYVGQLNRTYLKSCALNSWSPSAKFVTTGIRFWFAMGKAVMHGGDGTAFSSFLSKIGSRLVPFTFQVACHSCQPIVSCFRVDTHKQISAAMTQMWKLLHSGAEDTVPELLKISGYQQARQAALNAIEQKKTRRGHDPQRNTAKDTYDISEFHAMSEVLYRACQTAMAILLSALFLMCHACGMRSDDAQCMLIADLQGPKDFPNVGPHPCLVWTIVLNGSKTKKHNSVQHVGFTRNLDVKECCVGALGRYLVHRFMTIKEPFPDPLNWEADWSTCPLFKQTARAQKPKGKVGQEDHNNGAVSYDYFASMMKALLTTCEVATTKVCHAMRTGGTQLLEMLGCRSSDIEAWGRWCQGVSDSHYKKEIPLTPMLAVAGVKHFNGQKDRIYWTERFTFLPPQDTLDECAKILFPCLEPLKLAVRQVPQAQRIGPINVVRFIESLVLDLVQDAAEMKHLATTLSGNKEEPVMLMFNNCQSFVQLAEDYCQVRLGSTAPHTVDDSLEIMARTLQAQAANQEKMAMHLDKMAQIVGSLQEKMSTWERDGPPYEQLPAPNGEHMVTHQQGGQQMQQQFYAMALQLLHMAGVQQLPVVAPVVAAETDEEGRKRRREAVTARVASALEVQPDPTEGATLTYANDKPLKQWPFSKEFEHCYTALSYTALSYTALSYTALSYPALLSLTHLYPTLSYPALLSLTLLCPTMSYSVEEWYKGLDGRPPLASRDPKDTGWRQGFVKELNEKKWHISVLLPLCGPIFAPGEKMLKVASKESKGQAMAAKWWSQIRRWVRAKLNAGKTSAVLRWLEDAVKNGADAAAWLEEPGGGGDLAGVGGVAGGEG
eukprot:gene27864-12041_t